MVTGICHGRRIGLRLLAVLLCPGGLPSTAFSAGAFSPICREVYERVGPAGSLHDSVVRYVRNASLEVTSEGELVYREHSQLPSAGQWAVSIPRAVYRSLSQGTRTASDGTRELPVSYREPRESFSVSEEENEVRFVYLDGGKLFLARYRLDDGRTLLPPTPILPDEKFLLLSAEGEFLVTASESNRIYVFSRLDGRYLKHVEIPEERGGILALRLLDGIAYFSTFSRAGADGINLHDGWVGFFDLSGRYPVIYSTNPHELAFIAQSTRSNGSTSSHAREARGTPSVAGLEPLRSATPRVAAKYVDEGRGVLVWRTHDFLEKRGHEFELEIANVGASPDGQLIMGYFKDRGPRPPLEVRDLRTGRVVGTFAERFGKPGTMVISPVFLSNDGSYAVVQVGALGTMLGQFWILGLGSRDSTYRIVGYVDRMNDFPGVEKFPWKYLDFEGGMLQAADLSDVNRARFSVRAGDQKSYQISLPLRDVLSRGRVGVLRNTKFRVRYEDPEANPMGFPLRVSGLLKTAQLSGARFSGKVSLIEGESGIAKGVVTFSTEALEINPFLSSREGTAGSVFELHLDECPFGVFVDILRGITKLEGDVTVF